jgi:hypothetical protein
MAVSLHHAVIETHDLPGPARFWCEVPPTTRTPRRAKRDGGPPAEGWVVLADPEGNEFCVLRSKASLIAFRDVTVQGP